MTTRRASIGELWELWSLLRQDLTAKLSPNARKHASPELLGVARRFLKDNGQTFPMDDEARQGLQVLYRLYLRRLSEAVGEDAPLSAAVLAEARAFLQWHGAGDIPGTAAGKAAAQLLALDVPFKTKH